MTAVLVVGACGDGRSQVPPTGSASLAGAATPGALQVAAVWPLEALGRDAPISVDFEADDRGPTTTNPAAWFLPAGYVPDPGATSVEVLVDEQGCTGGAGAEGNTAEPVVVETPTEVRIAVSTYIRKGFHGCPGHPLAPVVVELQQPLGKRTLVDVHGTVDEANTLRGDVQVPAAG